MILLNTILFLLQATLIPIAGIVAFILIGFIALIAKLSDKSSKNNDDKNNF